jgi:hypothetical protein
LPKGGWLQPSFDSCTLKIEYTGFQGESQPVRKDKLPGKGAMTSEKERAIDLAPDGATNSIVPQAMILVGDNDTPFVKARLEAGHGRFRLR